MVRLRQIIDEVRHRLLVIPILFVLGSIALSQLMLWLDRRFLDDALPPVLETTVGSGRAILSSMAGGLISSVTLLLSLMLVAVQLASSQFSPRTLRDWIGDRTQQNTIGVVLGTSVYCLLVLRETREFGEGDALTPHLSVLLALALGVLSLVAVVRSVDHLTNSLRIGSVASRIMDETVKLVRREDRPAAMENPGVVPASETPGDDPPLAPPADARPVVAPSAGWIQQIDEDALLRALPEGTTAYVMVALGTFTMPDAPMAWVWPAPDDDESLERLQAAVAVGDTRTLQQDIGFGILQMVDIALRALSPGVNDPNTANDVIAHLGVVMLALWERPLARRLHEENGRRIVRHDPAHADYLHAGFDQLRRSGAAEPEVSATIIRVLASIRRETERRGLPGPLEPLDEVMRQTIEAVEVGELSDFDKDLVRDAVPSELRPVPGTGRG